MKVLHVISSISRSAGGPARSVQGLVAELNCAGVETWLLTLRHGDKPWVDGVEHFVNGERFEDVALLVKPQIVHLHGLWNAGLHRCAVICRRWHIPYVVAPRGMLEPWSLQQKWLKKRIARWWYQDRDLKCAAALHATAVSEAEQFRKLGFKNPIIISPNGVNVPSNPQFPVPRSPFPIAVRRVLFVSRMHPKKGVMELVEAWGRLVLSPESSVISRWCCELVYTVSGDIEKEYETKVKKRIVELGMSYQDTDGTIHSSPSSPSLSSPSPLTFTSSPTSPNFIFTGALNDDEKWKAYARADLLVLPTYSENFGIVVAEALWAGVPVITTKGTPWQELETWKCGKWIDLPEEGSRPSDWPTLVSALEGMMSMSDGERRQIGERGRMLVKEKYTWDAVVKAMVKGYESL